MTTPLDALRRTGAIQPGDAIRIEVERGVGSGVAVVRITVTLLPVGGQHRDPRAGGGAGASAFLEMGLSLTSPASAPNLDTHVSTFDAQGPAEVSGPVPAGPSRCSLGMCTCSTRRAAWK